jgi:putative oxidoreductase
MKHIFLSTHSFSQDVTALFTRLIIGILMFYHGAVKILNYQEYLGFFPDPIGLGSQLSLLLAIGAEAIGGLFVAIGLFTRLSLIPIFITMTVVFFVVHAGDPFQAKELALLFWLLSLLGFAAGPGRYSIDHILENRLFAPGKNQ